MAYKSRSINSLVNSVVAIFFFLISLVLQFISRKVFLDYLGTEILGLNTTAASLLQFLNLAELGIGSAIAFVLYKPMHDKDMQAVEEIISVQGWLYQKIAFAIMVASIILMCFFPLIFKNMQLPLWYAFATFGCLLFSALLGYFYNYKQVLISANQEEYKVLFSFRSANILKIILQIILIENIPQKGYIMWLLIECIFAIVSTLSINIVVKRTFPGLHASIELGKKVKNKYKIIITKIKQIFFHRIGSFALSQSAPLIIYTYSNLTLVSIYGNYMLLITGVTQLLNSMFNGMTASIGNLLAENNEKRNLEVFSELYTIRFLIISVLSFLLWEFSNPFITLWLGRQYLLSPVSLFLIIVIFFIGATRMIVHSYIQAYGLYSDIWAPLVEAVLNIGCACLLGNWFGLNGILVGIIISLVVIVVSWKPWFLFRYGLKYPFSFFLRLQTKHFVVFLVLSIIFSKLIKFYNFKLYESWLTLILYGISIGFVFVFCLFGILYICEPGMRRFMKRMMSLISMKSC